MMLLFSSAYFVVTAVTFGKLSCYCLVKFVSFKCQIESLDIDVVNCCVFVCCVNVSAC